MIGAGHSPVSNPVAIARIALRYHICIELRHRSTEGQLSRQELERQAADVLNMWERRVLEGKPVPPVRRAIAAPVAPKGPTPAEMLKAKYERMKAGGRV